MRPTPSSPADRTSRAARLVSPVVDLGASFVARVEGLLLLLLVIISRGRGGEATGT
jgi:hypothetical protein